MPTRKQRRREQKSKRHDYEFVYVDGEGNELDEVPEELEEQPKRERANGAKPAAAAKAQKSSASGKRGQQRALRQPPQPSWNRAVKRGGMLGIVVFVLFSLTAKGHYASVLPLALLYTLLFVPFTYYIDRFAYRRWEARQASGGATPAKSAKSTKSQSAKKR
jgi:hypothetical protein